VDTVIALCYALWVIKTGASDIKTFLLGIGLFVIGFNNPQCVAKCDYCDYTICNSCPHFIFVRFTSSD
ncbi:hypothetical protein ACT453_51890, partial [Bacillus sp. D-CC]